jgi:hypothetical protein
MTANHAVGDGSAITAELPDLENIDVIYDELAAVHGGGNARDANDQRSSRCAIGAPECERTERRLGTLRFSGATSTYDTHIYQLGLHPLPVLS